MNEHDQYLKQWMALRDGEGLRQAGSMLVRLRVVGGILTVAAAFLIYFEFSPILICLVSVVLGWVIAERNALRSRIALWPRLEEYLDWDLISKRAAERSLNK